MKNASELALEAASLAREIGSKLVGKGAAVQSAVLADLLATWVAGHKPELREQVLADHIALVRDLTLLIEKQIYGEAGWNGAFDQSVDGK